MIKGIVYISKASVDFDVDKLIELADMASGLNQQYDITGYLYFEKGFFLQYIEGPSAALDALLENIKRDKRHEVLNVQVSSEIYSRRFPTWHMHRLKKSALMQINMENVLMNYMTHTGKSGQLDVNEGNIWRMIDKLSKFRKKLSYSFD